MTSYSELLRTCTEFQENFSILNGKYEALSQNLKNETERSEKLQKKLESSYANEEKLNQQISVLKGEIDNLSGFKDKYNASTISLEHMKTRLEGFRRSITDAAQEHDQEVQQLKSQIKDLTQRIEVSSNFSRQKEMTKQLTEMEERCAAQQTQLVTEREAFSQRLLAAHNALREQQSRNLEYEQRTRSMENEVTEMRSALRRSVDLQNEAAMLKERYASEAVLSQQAAESARAEAEEYRKRLTQYHEEHHQELDETRRIAEEERQRLRERVASLTSALQDASAASQKERDKFNNLQRSVQQQVESARSESTVEITSLRQANSQLKEELQKQQWQLEQAREDLSQIRRDAEQHEGRNRSLNSQIHQLQQNLDEAMQREAWALAEKKHTQEDLDAARREIDTLTKVAVEHEKTTFELEKLKMLLQSKDTEIEDLRREMQDYEGRMEDLEDAATARFRTLKKELRQMKRLAKEESSKVDALRRKLVETLVQKEVDSYGHQTLGATVPHCLSPMESTRHTTSGGNVGGCAPYGDVMTLLASQSQKAEELQEKLLELAR